MTEICETVEIWQLQLDNCPKLYKVDVCVFLFPTDKCEFFLFKNGEDQKMFLLMW